MQVEIEVEVELCAEIDIKTYKIWQKTNLKKVCKIFKSACFSSSAVKS